MSKEITIMIEKGAEAFFHNNVDYCIGTGRMDLALTQEYQTQLALVQKEIGFQHIRGYGLFSDDMAIYQEYEEVCNPLKVWHDLGEPSYLTEEQKKCF